MCYYIIIGAVLKNCMGKNAVSKKSKEKDMSKIYNVIIVGGGFSGLICAIKLSKRYKDGVLLIEKLDRVGKKILATGNGRGNLTNENLSVNNYHGQHPFFCSYAIEKYGNDSLINFFRQLGLIAVKENGKYYPSGFQASAINDVLRLKLSSLNTDIITGAKVVDVKKKGKIFTVTTEDLKSYDCKKVILATGGKAQKQFGTDGSAYELAKKLGHKVTELYPSLVQIKTKPELIKGLKGIKQTAKLSLIKGGKEVFSTVGDLLFTEYGISGDSVFRLSAYLEGDKDSSVKIEFLPEFSLQDIQSVLLEKIKNLPYLTAEDLMTGIVNKQLGKLILKSVGIEKLSEQVKQSWASIVAERLKNFILPVTGTLGFDYAQVTHGGVNTEEVDRLTMQSILVDGLFFVGEVLDIDGDCGGYNLQWAYSSAIVASEAIIDEYFN